MKKNKIYISLMSVCFLFAVGLVRAQDNYEDGCIRCHQEQDMMPEGFEKYDIHLQAGLSCAGCHGGNPNTDDEDVAMSVKAGFKGVPQKKDIPKLCGKCHSNIDFMRIYQPRIPTDQVDQYYSSTHGQKLISGDKKVADCTSCHSTHKILGAHDSRSSVHAFNVPGTCNVCHGDAEYMKGYNLSTDQYKDFEKSVHGVALLENEDRGAPACNDCHGNHGAKPPGVRSVGHVCGTCHVNNMQYFTTSPMNDVFEDMGYHACEECHGKHAVHKTSDEMTGLGEKSTCVKCHDASDTGGEVALKIHENIRQVVTTLDSAEISRAEVQKVGMDDVEMSFLMQEAHQNLIQARTLVHTFDADKVAEKTVAGVDLARNALNLAQTEIDEYGTRRRGFGYATLFITILAIALFFKIRDMEAAKKKK